MRSPICAFVSRAINASQRNLRAKFSGGWGIEQGARNGFVGETDVPPRAASVIATYHAAATGVRGFRVLAKRRLESRGIDDNVRDYVVLAGADAAQELPSARPSSEEVNTWTVRGTQIEPAGVARSTAKEMTVPPGGSDLAPILRRACNRCGSTPYHHSEPIPRAHSPRAHRRSQKR